MTAEGGTSHRKKWLRWVPRNRGTRKVRQWLNRVRLLWRSVAWKPTSFQAFFVLASPRSGSGHLCSLIDSLPDTACLGEVLNPRGGYGLPGRAGSGAALRHIRRSLASLTGARRGAKLMLYQLGERRLSLDELNRAFPEARYLILYRESLVAQLVSERAALASRSWRSDSEHPRFRGRVRLSALELEAHRDRTVSLYTGCADAPWPEDRAGWIRYEDIARDPAAVFEQEICPLLGMSPTPVASSLKQQLGRDLSQLIENYEELRERIEARDMRLFPGSLRTRSRQPAPRAGPDTVSSSNPTSAGTATRRE